MQKVIRSSDFAQRETELEKSVDETAQLIVEAGCDWRKNFYGRRGVRWAEIQRPSAARAA